MRQPTKEQPNRSDDDDSELVMTEHSYEELRLLYRESSESVLFAKAQQWKTVGATLIVYLVLIIIARILPTDSGYANYLALLIFVFTPSSMYILLIYQLWQYTEMLKLDAIAERFSGPARAIRAIKSKREANFHRYTLFLCMFGVVILGGAVTYGAIMSLALHQ
jgi:hypothetical protein